MQISKERIPVDVEVEHVRQVFEKINERGDGLVDRGEIQRALKNPGASPRVASMPWDALDSSRLGV